MQTRAQLLGVLAVTSLLLAPTAAEAQSCPTYKTGSLQQITESFVNNKVPGAYKGLCAVVMDKNGTKGFHCAGKADGTNDLDHNSLFMIGSVTKIMTTTLLAKRLVEDPNFDLNDRLDPYLPTQYRRYAANPLKFSEMVSYRSGLDENPGEYLGPARSLEILGEKIDAGEVTPGPHAPDYANWPFQLVGFALAHKDGYGINNWFLDIYYNVLALNTMYVTKPWETWQANDPTYFNAHDAHAHEINSSGNYVDIGNTQHPRCVNGTANPSGCLYSSPHDMRLWLEYVMGLRTPTQILGQARNKMREPIAYYKPGHQAGMGWFFRTDLQCHADNYTRVFKSGDIDGMHTWVGFLQDPADKYGVSPLGVVLMANSDPKGMDIGELGHDLLSKIEVP